MRHSIEPRDSVFQTLCVLSDREIRPGPSVTFNSQVDLTEVETVRDAAKAAGAPKYSYTAFVVKALAMALKEFPYANRRVFRSPWLPFLGPRLVTFHAGDIAIGVERDTPGRENVAFVDVIRDADQRSLAEITEWLRALGESDAANNEQWRAFSTLAERLPYWMASRIIRLPNWFPGMWVKYRGAAALVTSPAKYGVDRVMGSWAWPLGVSFGYVAPRPVVRDGRIEVRRTFDLVLNFDRRVMAGAQAARFFNRMVAILEHAQHELTGPATAGGPSLPEPVNRTDTGNTGATAGGES